MEVLKGGAFLPARQRLAIPAHPA